MAASGNQGDRRRRGRPAARTGQRRPFDEASIARVVEVIRAWPSLPLTHDLLLKSVEARGIGLWSRQTVFGNETVSKVVDLRKSELARNKGKRPSRDPEVMVLRREVQDLNQQLAVEKTKVAEYEERFLIMRRNAAVRGISEGDLERPLHPLDRKAI